MKTLPKTMLALFCCTLIFSCKKDKNKQTEEERGKTRYLAGYIKNAAGKTVAAYWKDGVQFILTDGVFNAEATDITVSGNDIYVAGHESHPVGPNLFTVARYWKNGSPVNLSDGRYNAVAKSIFVSGNDIYVAGYEHNSTYDRMNARLWKNGAVVPLTDGTNWSFAHKVIVSENDVYVCGFEIEAGGTRTAKYWKNGSAVKLSDGSNSATANDIAVVGRDVYVVGWESAADGDSRFGKLWKNGVSNNLSDGTKRESVNAIVVVGNDVYIAGAENGGWGYKAKYWKNGVPTMLPTEATDESEAMSVFVQKDNVYIVGHKNRKPALWEKTTLEQVDVSAEGVFNAIRFK